MLLTVSNDAVGIHRALFLLGKIPPSLASLKFNQAAFTPAKELEVRGWRASVVRDFLNVDAKMSGQKANVTLGLLLGHGEKPAGRAITVASAPGNPLRAISPFLTIYIVMTMYIVFRGEL